MSVAPEITFSKIKEVSEKQLKSGACGYTYFTILVNAAGGTLMQEDVITLMYEKKDVVPEEHGLDLEILLELLHESFSGVYEKEQASFDDICSVIDRGNVALLAIWDKRGETEADPACSHYLLAAGYSFDTDGRIYLQCFDSSAIIESSYFLMDREYLTSMWRGYSSKKEYLQYYVEIDLQTYKFKSNESIIEELRKMIPYEQRSKDVLCYHDDCCSKIKGVIFSAREIESKVDFLS